MDFAEKMCKREHEQIYLFIAKCRQLWIKSVQLIFCKDNANESKGHLSLLEMSFAECSLSSAKILNSVY